MQKWIMAILFFGAAAFGTIVLFADTPTPPSEEELAAEANTLKIVATNWQFDQEEYVVEAGSTMTVTLENQQGIHGITIEGLDVDLGPDQLSQEVTFGEAGTEYTIVCSILCGPGHDDMVAKIIVQ